MNKPVNRPMHMRPALTKLKRLWSVSEPAREVLGSLGHLRIDESRIKPIESKPKSGTSGRERTEVAILVSTQSSNSSKRDDIEFIAVKKQPFDPKNDDRALAPFAREVSLLNDLSHENVVSIVGFVEDIEHGIAWTVFSWEKNGNLREFVRSANWELKERLCLVDDVASGLNYLHGRNPPICHGDIKSLNIVVNSNNRALITDFGSARPIDSPAERAVRSANTARMLKHQQKSTTRGPITEALNAEVAPSGEFITLTGPAWTVQWAAPELLAGDIPGLANDIWALGWICWEAVTGNFPFDKESGATARAHIARWDIPTVTSHDQLQQIETLCRLMGECWRLDANKRPTAMRCQEVLSSMDQTVPSPKETNSVDIIRSSGLLDALGRIQLRNGMVPEARDRFQQSLEVSQSVGDEWGRARALEALGDAYYGQSGYSKAEQSYIQARDIYSQVGSQVGFAQLLTSLGEVYRMRNEYSKAEESYVQARDIFSQIGNQLGVAQSVQRLGDIYRMRSEYSKAEESYIQARSICSRTGDQDGFAQAVKSLGDVYCMRDEYPKAEESYIQARDIYSQIGNQLGFAQSLKSLGDVYCVRSEYSKAEESFTRASDIYSQIGAQLGTAQSVKSLAEVYRMRREYSKAEESFIQARNLYSQLEDQLGFAQSVAGLGDVYRMRNEYSQAEQQYIQSRDIFSQIGNQLGFANAIQGLGRVYSARGEYAKARESYLEAQQVYRRIGDMRASASILWYLGSLHAQQAQYREAERLICEASGIYAELGLEQDVAECSTFLDKIRLLSEIWST